MVKYLTGTADNRTIQSNHILWPSCYGGSALVILGVHGAPWYELRSQAALTVSFWCMRAFLYFPPLNLPATAKILGATMQFYYTFTEKTSSPGFPYIYLMRSYWGPPVYTGMWGFENSQSEALGQIHLDNITPGQYNDIDLNQAGLDFLENAAINRFCVRTELDAKNLRPRLG
ncbi:unnamed protein product, partial [marine sediment metagenome]